MKYEYMYRGGEVRAVGKNRECFAVNRMIVLSSDRQKYKQEWDFLN